ncbi:MAG: HigA family addiction module antitoxin [Planctomycetota bacterium]
MKTPCHPGEILREAIIDELGLSITAAADGLGISRKTLSEILNGHAGISPDMAVRLERGVGSTAEQWLRLQMAFDLAAAHGRAKNIKVKKLEPA